ncbi:MAG: 5-deoxy-glucuronate isomerase [Candidatus Sericytochromatia bacterium]|nr:5-deoxy-glucuronate isomerase [Candidatus Tanganyikabacteria bacterium]
MAPRRLLFKPNQLHPGESGILTDLTPAQAGWNFVGLRVLRLGTAEFFSGETGGEEVVLVILSGKCDVKTAQDQFLNVGGRRTVFEGLPFSVYLPPGTRYTIYANTQLEVALCSAALGGLNGNLPPYPARLIEPYQVQVELRGDANASRTIHHMIKPEFRAHKIMVVEVLTPSGNWSSYPPHKHDVHNPPDEVDLEEIYYYRIDGHGGFAIQRVYTPDRRIDETLTVSDGDVVLVPEGYHPVVAAHGYWVYYLNVLAGSARSMAASDDPDYAWVRKIWRNRNPEPGGRPSASDLAR